MTAPPPRRRWFNWQQWLQGWRDFDSSFWWQQAITSALCLILALVISRFDYHLWLRAHWVLYVLVLAMLVAVLAIGVTGGGAARWIMLAGFKVQPSEFAKLAVILTAAALMHRWPVRRFSQIWLLGFAFLPPWSLIFLQPDLGTALIFIAIFAGMVYWGGARISWLLLLVSPAIAAIIYGIYANTPAKWLLWVWLLWVAMVCLLAVWTLPWRRIGAVAFTTLNLLAGVLGQIAWEILQPYQRQRLLIFMTPDSDPLGAGYHLIQSRIAIGAGGLFGQGFTQGTQTQLGFIPEQHTDFIFAAIGEEWGFVGAMVVLILIWLICIRLLAIAHSARDDFGALVCIGVFSMILCQSLVNIGMTIGLMPITGLPLPFVSYGRSALLTNYLALGIVEAIANYRQRTTFFT